MLRDETNGGVRKAKGASADRASSRPGAPPSAQPRSATSRRLPRSAASKSAPAPCPAKPVAASPRPPVPTPISSLRGDVSELRPDARFVEDVNHGDRQPDLEAACGEASSGSAPPVATDSSGREFTAKRVELILQQLDALPVLSAIAVQLLELTSDDTSQGKDVVRLVTSDPALSAKVLKLCRCSERGRGLNVTSVERAVLLLGFDALRSAVLSVQVFEMFDGVESPGGEIRGQAAVFDRLMFWQHSIAVACACESLAGAGGLCQGLNKADAFVCGLLHDLGVLALHVLLPRSFDRVCEFAEMHNVSLDQACRRIIGLDTHTAGRRLAEHWRLPHSMSDVLWLHGQRLESLPELPHKPQIALVTLADAMARQQCLAPAGHGPRGEDVNALARQLGLSSELIQDVCGRLHERVAERAASLGLHKSHDAAVMLRAISRANETLGRINDNMRQRAVLARRQAHTLNAITQFHDSASPGGSVVTVMGKVVRSAAGVFEGNFFAMLYQARIDDAWQLIQFSSDGRPVRSELIVPPPGSTAVSDLADDTHVSMQVLAMLPWLSDYLGDAHDLRDVQLLPLRCGWGVNAVLLHDCAIDGREAREQLDALSRTWAAAIAAAAQHEGAKRLGEQLAESNRALMDTQEELARSQALAAVGEIAAGAAHEMNNPLTVISGRSQLLKTRLRDAEQRLMAEQICEQSHRLSNMITALRMFAEPTNPNRREIILQQLLDSVLKKVRARYDRALPIEVVVGQALERIWMDPDQIGGAIAELLHNALESEGSTHVELRVQIEPADDRLKIQVTDNGSGLTPHVLAHAFDPFFSAKPAGRKPGLGLAQARRWVEAHGGQIALENGKVGGAVATIRLDRWRVPSSNQRREVA